MKSIKILGLAAVTALALTVFAGVASAAAPGYFTAGSYPASVKAVPSYSEGGSYLSTVVGKTQCGTNTGFTETISTAKDTLNGAATKFCSDNLYVDLSMNGCEFLLHPPIEGINGTVDLGGAKCAGATGYQIEGAPMTIPPQTGLAATFENEGTGTGAKVRVHLQTTKLKYEIASGIYSGTYTNGTYTPTWTLSGENGGKATGVSVHAAPGFSFKSGWFLSELYPVTTGGEQTSGVIEAVEYTKLTFEGVAGNAKCAVMKFATPWLTYYETGEMEMAPTFGTCTFGGVSATVTPAAGCHYRMEGNGTLAICGVEVVKGSCKVTIPAQSRSGLEFVNKGTGATAHVEAKVNVKTGLEYQVSGSGCPVEKAPGTYTDGKYRGVVNLNVIKVG